MEAEMLTGMAATGPGASRSVFPLLHMLDVMPGVFQDHLLPALQDQHKAALACTCSALRVLIQQRVTTLKLFAGQCCRVHDDRLAGKLPAVTALRLRPGNLHEALFVLPIFFMQDARFMPGITSLQFLDQLPDRPPCKVQCGSCTAWTTTYDLSAILATAATCMPNLAALDFSTHYISDAECAAISLMTGLTRLQLRSTHGTKAGGMARFSSLKKLADLRLTDVNQRSEHTDVAMLLGRTCLTRLRLGYYPQLLPPLLNSLVELQDAAGAAAEAAGGAASGRRGSDAAAASGAAAQRQLRNAASQAAGNAALAAARAHVGNSSASGGSRAIGDSADRQPNNATPLQPPPLRELSVTLSPYMHYAQDSFKALVALTRLTNLRIGWFVHVQPDHDMVAESVAVMLPQQQQRELSQLVQLVQLGIGWTPSDAVLGVLGYLTGLTALQLGGLPTHPLPSTLKLPSLRCLTAPTTPNLSSLPTNPQPGSLCALAAFPGLTRLELTGMIGAAALQQLPSVAPQLQEVLLPQRLWRVGWSDLAALQRLSGLTSLRLGWKAGLHNGPPTLPDEENPQEEEDWMFEPVAVLAPGVGLGVQPQQVLAQPPPEVLAAAAYVQQVAAADATCPVSLSALTELQVPAAGSTKQQDAAQAAAAAAEQPAPTQPDAAAAATCSTYGTAGSIGCLCSLAKLEIVGPASGSELLHLASLPGLRTLLLRDNPSWSTGLPCDDLAQLLAGSSSIRRLELVACPGVSGLQIEQALLAIPAGSSDRGPDIRVTVTQQGTASVSTASSAGTDGLQPAVPNSAKVPHAGMWSGRDRLGRCDIVVRTDGGRSAAQLGMGYQYYGTVLSAAEDRGDPEVVAWGGAAEAEEEEEGDGVNVFGPQLPQPPHFLVGQWLPQLPLLQPDWMQQQVQHLQNQEQQLGLQWQQVVEQEQHEQQAQLQQQLLQDVELQEVQAAHHEQQLLQLHDEPGINDLQMLQQLFDNEDQQQEEQEAVGGQQQEGDQQ